MSSSDNENIKKMKVQEKVIKILNETNYSLKVNNRYKENIIHVSAANNCVDILKCILQKYDTKHLEKKNSFGWTPLMQAVRNENTEMVNFLLSKNVIVNDFSFLGMSVLSLSCAISTNMFDLLYNNYPTALEYAAYDDINPLCVALLKNDEELFFKLVHLGLNVSEANDFTQIMMKQSTNPKIAVLAKLNLISQVYWTNLSNIENLLCNMSIPQIKVFEPDKVPCKKNIFFNQSVTISELSNHQRNVSPSLTYIDKKLPVSPFIYVEEQKVLTDVENATDLRSFTLEFGKNPNLVTGNESFSLALSRCQDNRPPNLNLQNVSMDSNVTLSFTPQFSPTKSPNLPNDINEDNIFDEHSPSPPKYKTPPRGIILDTSTTRLIFLLQQCKLEKYISTFIDQEVDLELFLTLTDVDLIEIGVDNKLERSVLLSTINEHNRKRIKFS